MCVTGCRWTLSSYIFFKSLVGSTGRSTGAGSKDARDWSRRFTSCESSPNREALMSRIRRTGVPECVRRTPTMIFIDSIIEVVFAAGRPNASSIKSATVMSAEKASASSIRKLSDKSDNLNSGAPYVPGTKWNRTSCGVLGHSRSRVSFKNFSVSFNCYKIARDV